MLPFSLLTKFKFIQQITSGGQQKSKINLFRFQYKQFMESGWYNSKKKDFYPATKTSQLFMMRHTIALFLSFRFFRVEVKFVLILVLSQKTR